MFHTQKKRVIFLEIYILKFLVVLIFNSIFCQTIQLNLFGMGKFFCDTVQKFKMDIWTKDGSYNRQSEIIKFGNDQKRSTSQGQMALMFMCRVPL